MKEVRVFYCNDKPVEFSVEKIDSRVTITKIDAVRLIAGLSAVLADSVPQQTEKQTPAKPPSAPTITAEQKTALKTIKEKMKISNNDELNSYVQNWSLHNKQTWRDITPESMNDFIKFMQKEVDGLQDDSKAPF